MPPSLRIERLSPALATWSGDIDWLVTRYFHALAAEIHQTPARDRRRVDPGQSAEVMALLEGIATQQERACLFIARNGEARWGYFLGMLKDCVGEIPRSVGYVNGLYVEPPYRKLGIGSLLLQAGWSWFRQHGATLVELYTAVENIPALRFWQKHGFFQSEIVMLAPVNDFENVFTHCHPERSEGSL